MKRVLIWLAGGLMMLSGMFVGIAVSIFAKQTSDDYWEVRIFSQGGQNVWDLESWLVWGRSLLIG